jgi:hypothetical protein
LDSPQNQWVSIKIKQMEEAQTQYELVRGNGNNEELEKYRQCFLENGTNKSIELLKWLHQKNLPGLQTIYYAIDKKTGEIAATYAYVAVMIKCMGKIVVGMQAIDALTDYRHRSKGLFVILASRLAKEESAKNNELVYGFPNENAVDGQVKKVGFTYFGEIPFLIKPLRISYFLKQFFRKKPANDTVEINCKIEAPEEVLLKNNCSIKSISGFGEDYNKLWLVVAPQINIGVNRDAAYMNWRYVDKPGEDYSKYGLYETGILKGIVIFTLKNKYNGKIGFLMEILFDPENEQTGKKLLKFCSGILKRNKADLILAWCLPHSFIYSCHRKAGFYKFPEKIRPQKLGMIAKTLNSNHAEDINNIKNWFFSYSDSDTV